MSVVALALAATTVVAVAAALPAPAAGRRATGLPGPAPKRARGAPGAGGRPLPADLAVAATVALVLGLAVPPLALAALAVPAVRRRLAARRAQAAARRTLGSALPDAVDLLLLCTGAGLSLPLAVPLVARRAPDPIGAALLAAEAEVQAGGPRADALLVHLAPLGDPAATLAHVLVDHLRHGVALGPGLERAALELRLARRRHAEEGARRLPVRLLAPLLTCVLPAFVLLTVVPLVVAALRSLPR